MNSTPRKSFRRKSVLPRTLEFSSFDESRRLSYRNRSSSVTSRVFGPVIGLHYASKSKKIRFQPTYRLESQNPINLDRCEKIIKDILDVQLKDFKFTKYSTTLTRNLSEEIKSRIKMQLFDRYRLICVVTIGEKIMQSLVCKACFLWDSEKDTFINYIYDTPNFFAYVTLYGVYYD